MIHLGINDTDPRNWPDFRDEFVADYLQLVSDLRKANPHAVFYIARLSLYISPASPVQVGYT